MSDVYSVRARLGAKHDATGYIVMVWSGDQADVYGPFTHPVGAIEWAEKYLVLRRGFAALVGVHDNPTYTVYPIETIEEAL